MRISDYTCRSIYIRRCMSISIYMYVWREMCVDVWVPRYMYVWICIYDHVCIHMYIYVFIVGTTARARVGSLDGLCVYGCIFSLEFHGDRSREK